MKWLIRRVLKKSKGAVQYEEKVWQGDGLTIGRATDQAIFLSDLRAALRHVVVTRAAQGKYKIESLMLAGIRVDGELTYSTLAGPGSVIEIGDTRIQLLAAPRGYDGAVEMTTLGKDEADAKSARLKPMRLTQTWLRKRPLSWLLFVGIFLFGLILPMFGYFKPEVGKRLEHAFLPSAVSWIPGTMTASHQFIESDCGRCHQTPFRAVRDEACTACHAKTAAHFDAAKFREAGLGNDACRACHQDHQGREGLVRRDQRLCANCHRDLKERVGALAASEDVSDFGTAHPEFELNLPDWNDQGEFVPLPTVFAKDLRENSGLKFNHAKHLAADGLKAPKGQRVLDCADCHAPEPGGARMRPVRFETMCHECHTLGFDALAPQREVPHGKVSEVVYMLGEYYAKFALEGGYLDAKAPTIVQQRRRPGSPPLARQDRAEALTWARDQTAKVTQSLFVDRACTTCHKVTAPDADNPQWRVAPVRVAGAWYLGAKFSHAKHNTAKCEDCHGARDSKEAADLLIPGIDNCRGCHAGAYARDKVPSTCITCHDYHPQAAQTKR